MMSEIIEYMEAHAGFIGVVSCGNCIGVAVDYLKKGNLQ